MSHNHEDAEKELAEVMDLYSKYLLYLAESEKSELENECDRCVCLKADYFPFLDNIS